MIVLRARHAASFPVIGIMSPIANLDCKAPNSVGLHDQYCEWFACSICDKYSRIWKLEKLSSIDDRGETDRVTIRPHALDSAVAAKAIA